jgi:predicted  nucleic acid-binding Zn-ribbon protein
MNKFELEKKFSEIEKKINETNDKINELSEKLTALVTAFQDYTDTNGDNIDGLSEVLSALQLRVDDYTKANDATVGSVIEDQSNFRKSLKIKDAGDKEHLNDTINDLLANLTSVENKVRLNKVGISDVNKALNDHLKTPLRKQNFFKNKQ